MFGLIKFVSKYKENFLLASGHFATDICQDSVSAALAVMFAHNVLSSNIEVSYLVLASCLVSSIMSLRHFCKRILIKFIRIINV